MLQNGNFDFFYKTAEYNLVKTLFSKNKHYFHKNNCNAVLRNLNRKIINILKCKSGTLCITKLKISLLYTLQNATSTI